VSLEGQGRQLGPRTFEFDHTFDLAFTSTQLDVRRADRTDHVVIVNDAPEPLRFALGGASVFGGGVALGYALFVANDRSSGFTASSPDVIGTEIAASGFMALGLGMMLTGWHPSRKVTEILDTCEDAPATSSRAPARDNGPYER
jgi:hypothetical protein